MAGKVAMMVLWKQAVKSGLFFSCQVRVAFQNTEPQNPLDWFAMFSVSSVEFFFS